MLALSRHRVTATAVVALLASFGVAALTVVNPGLATVAIATPIVCCGIWWHPKTSALLVALLVLGTETAETFVPRLSLLDEASVATFVVVVGVRQLVLGRTRRVPGSMWILLYVLAGVVSTLVHGVPASLAGQDAFLFLKGFLFSAAVTQLDWNIGDVSRIVRAGVVVLAVIFAAGVINVLTGDFWFSRFAIDRGSNSRGGLPSLVGPFQHPHVFGHVMALAAAAFASHAAAYGATRRTTAGLLASMVGTASSLRRAAVVGMLAAVGFVALSVRRRRLALAMGLAFLVPLMVLIFSETLTTIVKTTYHDYFAATQPAARTVLYKDSAVLAASNFPFGVGLGRYGGRVALTDYSPVYLELGFSRIFGLTPNGAFGTDTFWPAILGEAGVLGLVGYAGGLVALTNAARRLARRAAPASRFIGLLGVAWSLEYLLESSAAPVYSAPPTYALLFGALGVAVALGRSTVADAREVT